MAKECALSIGKLTREACRETVCLRKMTVPTLPQLFTVDVKHPTKQNKQILGYPLIPPCYFRYAYSCNVELFDVHSRKTESGVPTICAHVTV